MKPPRLMSNYCMIQTKRGADDNAATSPPSASRLSCEHNNWLTLEGTHVLRLGDDKASGPFGILALMLHALSTSLRTVNSTPLIKSSREYQRAVFS